MNGLENIVVHRHEDDQFLFETYGYARRAKDLIKGTAILWISGNTFRNACDIMTLYVTGLLPTSPSHAGPILSESSGIGKYLAQCNRNGILTLSSEPAQVDYGIHDLDEFVIENANIEIMLRKHNLQLLLSTLKEYDSEMGSVEPRFQIKELEGKLSQDLGVSYSIADDGVHHLGIIDRKKGSNELYQILANVSKEFTDHPVM